MAGRYICPVCDKRLKTKHFCTYCKSFVKEPVYYTGPVANESYDSAGRPSCMADQHYGLGHVHHPGDRQREYGHHKAGTGARQNPPARQSTHAQGSRFAQQPARSGQNGGIQQRKEANRKVKKLMAVFWVFILIIVLVQVVFTMIGNQGMGLSGGAFYFVPFRFLIQFFNMALQVGLWALIVWAIVRKARRK